MAGKKKKSDGKEEEAAERGVRGVGGGEAKRGARRRGKAKQDKRKQQGKERKQGKPAKEEEGEEGEREQTLEDLEGCGPLDGPWVLDHGQPVDEQEAKVDALCDQRMALNTELHNLNNQISMQDDPQERRARIKEHQLAIQATEMKRRLHRRKDTLRTLQLMADDEVCFKREPSFQPRFFQTLSHLERHRVYLQQRRKNLETSLAAKRFDPFRESGEEGIKGQCRALLAKNREIGEKTSRANISRLENEVKELSDTLSNLRGQQAPLEQAEQVLQHQLHGLQTQTRLMKRRYYEARNRGRAQTHSSEEPAQLTTATGEEGQQQQQTGASRETLPSRFTIPPVLPQYTAPAADLAAALKRRHQQDREQEQLEQEWLQDEGLQGDDTPLPRTKMAKFNTVMPLFANPLARQLSEACDDAVAEALQAQRARAATETASAATQLRQDQAQSQEGKQQGDSQQRAESKHQEGRRAEKQGQKQEQQQHEDGEARVSRPQPQPHRSQTRQRQLHFWSGHFVKDIQ